MDKYDLKCGAAKADITPPIGTILYGYAPGRPAQAIGDRLEATAIMLTSNTGSALLITLTICSVNCGLSDELRAIAAKEAGIEPTEVTVCCTHTHSGPNASTRSGWGEVDYKYIEEILKPAVKKAAAEAKSALRSARMGIAEIESDVAMNRRQVREDGTIALGQNPWGIHDPRMTVMSFVDNDGKTIANFIHYGCHGTASGANPEITRDWSGVMTDMLEAESGGITGFYDGFEGDQGPKLPNGRTTGNYTLALQLGAKAGIDAVKAWKSIKEYREVPVRVLCGDVKIPFDPLASREEAEEKLAKLGTLEEIYAQKRYSQVNEYMHWVAVIAEHNAQKTPQTHFVFPQSITTIGPAAIIPAPFEAFCEIGLRLRAHSPYAYTLSLSNAHGSYAYLPTKNDIPSGGYEVWHFLLAMRTLYPLPKNTDDYWVKENLAIMRGGNA